ncbi:uncharacterized protein LOC106471273 [Limulus polyphemus]|uniref:Uncharacterized protein LOC106471273 n=1 Tax=Limulus polyphemus TaxID=6850 RepID=A0ABM1TI83_LIMPO|nr:uncharacterized protein LOC106471273 [Limulus polyphemus]XP_022255585.1 uncharacterized protein LOC106471273 [Limulus polyphemus]XP_022255586.1 uncharacterized protein LOC106471273 [Limulus polyphemus]XP_022255588.1 uncharacterized protein LOC106471273 [Limulus polyphemus]XP_022255589.1 uncharacterized protein LOC106471273 [Limulus polyphemus]
MKTRRGVLVCGVLLALLLQSWSAPVSDEDNEVKSDEKKGQSSEQQSIDDEETVEEKEIEVMEAGILDSIQKFFDSDDPDSGISKISDYVKNFGEALKDVVNRTLSGINGFINGLSTNEGSDDEKKETENGGEIEGSK